jgi:NADH-quinone oxidoreductase subunit E
MLSEVERREIEAEMAHYEFKQAACVEALKIVQRHRGWVSDESIRDVAAVLEMTPHELDSIATFYSLIFRHPVGRHVILLCDSVSCWIMGYPHLRQYLQTRLGLGLGETSADGQFTLLPMPCLGACDHAPTLMIDEELYGDLDPEKLDRVLDLYKMRREGDGATAHPEHPSR